MPFVSIIFRELTDIDPYLLVFISFLQYDEHGPFDSLEELEKKPAHLAVFLHYLISNSDPSSMVSLDWVVLYHRGQRAKVHALDIESAYCEDVLWMDPG